MKAQPALTPQQQAALAKLEQQAEQTPDFLADPKGYIDTKLDAVEKARQADAKKTEQTQEQVQQAEQLRQVFNATLNAEQAFVAQQPDYPQALEHIRTVRRAQLQELYPEATGEQVANHIAYEERETARGLIAQNRNPAEFAYKIARTLGYQPPKAPDPKPQPKPIDKDAVRTLGSGGGDGAPADDAGGSMPELQAALQERFKPRKR